MYRLNHECVVLVELILDLSFVELAIISLVGSIFAGFGSAIGIELGKETFQRYRAAHKKLVEQINQR